MTVKTNVNTQTEHKHESKETKTPGLSKKRLERRETETVKKKRDARKKY